MKANLLLIAATLLLALSACNKISESIQRDVIIKPDSILFSIPPKASSQDSAIINDLPTTVNIINEINNLGGETFGLDNITNVRLSNISITYVPKTKDSVDTKNNFSNIGSIMLNLNNGLKRDSLAKVVNTGSIDAVSRIFTLTPVMKEELLKEYLNLGNLKYSLVIKFRKPTTDTIKAKISASYTLTLKK
ncbi:hypothetical protein [Pedobacter gandavensis]|uniref:DUF1439 domain-containing protein n=1 Tax=Pedobacter gandavensis TaxID=2679963 RepID=A0ABR6ET56_9SPHI|nr:hypothetical protein [Pedobacter gandavensis]MBB2148387.1 hypothetical protein [Pedobacter gandavensis]